MSYRDNSIMPIHPFQVFIDSDPDRVQIPIGWYKNWLSIASSQPVRSYDCSHSRLGPWTK
jgi:hypothetical protein